MNESSSTVTAAVVMFASTNLDDAVMLAMLNVAFRSTVREADRNLGVDTRIRWPNRSTLPRTSSRRTHRAEAGDLVEEQPDPHIVGQSLGVGHRGPQAGLLGVVAVGRGRATRLPSREDRHSSAASPAT